MSRKVSDISINTHTDISSTISPAPVPVVMETSQAANNNVHTGKLFSTHCNCEYCKHRNMCEKILGNMCGNTNMCIPSLKDWLDFRVYCKAVTNDDGCCYGLMCFPITFPMKTVFCLPCAAYNDCRNRCNGTTNQQYLNYLF